jgi:hypothetical protein
LHGIKPGNPYPRVRVIIVDHLALTSLDQFILKLKELFAFSTKMSYLNEEVNCTEPPSSVRVPWIETLIICMQSVTKKNTFYDTSTG